MRFLLFILLNLFFFSSSFSQERFNKIYPAEINEICMNVMVMDDGYIMAIGSDTLIEGSWERCFRLQKVDLEGNVVWSKKYGAKDEKWYEGWENALFKDTDTSFCMVGTRYPVEGGNFKHPFFMKFDNYGDTLYSKFYKFYDQYAIPNGMMGIKTSDNGFAICGQFQQYTDSTYAEQYPFNGVLIKTDSMGEMQWYKSIGGAEHDLIYRIVQTSDGGYMLGGKSNSYGSSYDMYLVKTDSLGNEQWHQTYGGSYDELQISGLIAIEGAVIFTGGDVTYYNSTTLLEKSIGVIKKISNSGGLVWEKEYDFFYDHDNVPDSNYCLLKDIVELSNGNLAAISKIRVNVPDLSYGSQRSSLFLLNSEGDSLWTQIILLSDYDNDDNGGFLRDIELTTEGGFIIVGDTWLNDESIEQQVWLVKVDSLGDDGTFIKEYKQLEIIVSVFPNPTSDHIYFRLSGVKESTIKLHSITGILVKEEKIYNIEEKIIVSDLSDGIYILTIEKKGKVVYATKIIKQ